MTDNTPLLILFDGNALVHRAFHALPPMTVSKTGEMVNAVRGFASTLLKILAEIKPSHWAIAFDRSSPTFRHEKFADYKAQRPETPQELRNQITRVHQLAEAFRIPIFEMDGYEADDVLGTLSTQANQKGIGALIVTGDNDMLQMVSPGIKVMSPRRSFSDTVIYDEAEVRQKYGLDPAQIPDYKALTGDASDNIPGVRGIGEKTATKLLQQFGSISSIYERIDDVVPQRIQTLLRDGKEQALQSQELATIISAVPITLNLEDCRVSAYDRNQVVSLFQELEFVGLLSRLPGEIQQPMFQETVKPPAPAVDYHVINTIESLEGLIRQLQSAAEFAFDTETSGLQAISADLAGISLSCKSGEAYYIPVGHRGLSTIEQLPLAEVITRLKPLFEDMKLSKIAQNAKFDMTVLAEKGIQVKNVTFDTMIAAYILGEKALGLKSLAFNRLGVEMKPITDLIGKGAKQISMALVDIQAAADYSCADADMTCRLKDILAALLQKEGLWQLFSELEMPLIPVLLDMERTGVALDTDLLRDMSRSLGEDMARLEKEIYSSIGHQFNINSPQQLSGILFDELKLDKSRKTKSGYSTDASVLEYLKGAHPVIDLILQYRQLGKLKSTYTDALLALINPKTGRVHTSFNQTGTSTGRLSSSEPNLQNIPVRNELGGRIRQSIIARPGWMLLSADYSQIDLRALAHISKDTELVNTFLRDEDVHTATAAKVFNVEPGQVNASMRRAAKTVNFGVIYGMSGYGLEQATDLNREEAGKFITAYFEKYPGIKRYIEDTKMQAREMGYVQTVMGRRRYIPEINSPNRQIREGAERMAINMPVQGTSADIIKVAMIRIYQEMEKSALKSKMLLQVHDELVFEVAPGEMDRLKEMAARVMTDAMDLIVPLKVDMKMGKNWLEME